MSLHDVVKFITQYLFFVLRIIVMSQQIMLNLDSIINYWVYDKYDLERRWSSYQSDIYNFRHIQYIHITMYKKRTDSF